MKKFWTIMAFFIGLGVGVVIALLFTPYSSSTLKSRLRTNIKDEYGNLKKRADSFSTKWDRFSSSVDDMYRLYTRKDEIIPTNEVYSKTFF